MDDRIKPTVVIAGASGSLGSALARRLADAFEVVCLVRKPTGKLPGTEVVWDAKSLGDWATCLEGARAVINLCGSPIAVRWTAEARKEIIDSRVVPTKLIGEAIDRCSVPPMIWLNGSAVGYYGDQRAKQLTEESPRGEGFLAVVCEAWEAAAKTKQPTRINFLRTGVVLDAKAGALETWAKLAKNFLGGQIGDGKQYIPWIAKEDWLAMVAWLLQINLEGPANLCAPHPETNQEFMSTLRFVLHKPWSPPVPTFAFKAGAAVLGVPPEVALISQNAVPMVAQQHGFEFRYPELEGALRAELGS